MNILIVFDDLFDIKQLNKSIKDHPASINLFPLTSNFLTIERIKTELQSFPRVKITELKSAKCINDEVNILQQRIHKWSCSLGNQKIGKKKLKEWLLLPDASGSAWWFGLISEKNSVQDDAFFKIAQINAVKNQIENNNYDVCLFAVSDRKLKKIYMKIARLLKKNTHAIPIESNRVKKSIKIKLLDLINGMGVLGALFSAGIHWLIWLRDSREARRRLPSLKKRLEEPNTFLFVTYFPNIDAESAEQGIFRNKYALPLQKKLNELTIPITWMLMPVYYNGHNFKSAMHLAKKFLDNGEKLFVLQEFFTIKIFLKSLAWWMRQTVLSYFLFRLMDKKLLVSDLTHLTSLPIIKYLWWHSFIGTSGVRGIIFYLTYQEIFKSLPKTRNCLYYCEMQAWEKALITAKNYINPKIKTLAFQHTVVMRNYFNYFYDKSETHRSNKIFDLPLPDILIANGKVTYSLLAESNYPNLYEAEAVRQLYLNGIASHALTKTNNQAVLLVVGSYDKNETKSLISMVFTAFGKSTKFFTLFKGSPVNPMEPIFKELGIDITQTNYKILHEDISELLKLTTVALVANTTVAIEAAVCGCAVVVPIFADTMLMNPIVDTCAEYHLASTAEHLKSLVEQEMLNQQTHQSNRTTQLIENYWNIDTNLPLWTKILQTAYYAAD